MFVVHFCADPAAFQIRYMVLMCAALTEFGVVVVPVVVQSHNVLLLFEEVMVGLSLQVQPSDSDVLW